MNLKIEHICIHLIFNFLLKGQQFQQGSTNFLLEGTRSYAFSRTRKHQMSILPGPLHDLVKWPGQNLHRSFQSVVRLSAQPSFDYHIDFHKEKLR